MIYSQTDVDDFEIVSGVKICPSGSYAPGIDFGERCSFGEWCRDGGSVVLFKLYAVGNRKERILYARRRNNIASVPILRK